MSLLSGIDLFSFVPALGAVTLSLKNWLELRQGAVLHPVRIVNFGLWGIKTSEKKNKLILLPIIVANEGSKSGMITRVTAEFDGRELDILKKIELVSHSDMALRGMGVHEFRNKGIVDQNPFYPIDVNSKENTSFMVECFDKDNVVPIGKPSTCKLTVEYGNGKIKSLEFPFLITDEEYEKSCDQLIWIRNE